MCRVRGTALYKLFLPEVGSYCRSCWPPFVSDELFTKYADECGTKIGIEGFMRLSKCISTWRLQHACLTFRARNTVFWRVRHVMVQRQNKART